jgi:hypothetical protein
MPGCQKPEGGLIFTLHTRLAILDSPFWDILSSQPQTVPPRTYSSLNLRVLATFYVVRNIPHLFFSHSTPRARCAVFR